MKITRLLAVGATCAAVGGAAAWSQMGPPAAEASDHDEGGNGHQVPCAQNDRHFAFTTTADALAWSVVNAVAAGGGSTSQRERPLRFHLTKVAARGGPRPEG